VGILVLKPGTLATVQDLGRPGLMGAGVAPGGALDRRAAVLANLLVGNRPAAPLIECAFPGLALRFTQTTYVALTGADLGARVDGRPLPGYRVWPVAAGSELRFGERVAGVWAYLAVAGGGLAVEPVLGSCSTNVTCGLGGWQGRPLRAGDQLPLVTNTVAYLPGCADRRLDAAAERARVHLGDTSCVPVRAVPGPQDDRFTRAGLETLFGSPYQVDARSNRMGYRLDGPAVEARAPGTDIPSDGIPLGAVQVPGHGRPIVMLADRQVTGGYAKAACVASVDLARLVQRAPGEAVRFERVDVRAAQEARARELAWLREQARRLALPGAAATRRPIEE
jgi:biotin-dependent carboxylase-like uncharacterized protein